MIKLRFYVTIFLFVLPSLLLAQSSKKYIKLWDLKKQVEHKRTFKNIRQLKEIKLDALGIYNPYILDSDEKGNLALRGDSQSKRGIVYLSASKGYKSPIFIGKGIGGGPEEFRFIKDIKFDTKGHIWVSDPQQARISIWQPDGKLIRDLNLNGLLPATIAIQKKAFYTLPMRLKEKKLLYRVKKNGDITKSFQPIPEQGLTSPLYYEGNLDSDQTGLYYAGLTSGFIRKYDLVTGELIYSRATIVSVPLEALKEKKLSATATAISRGSDIKYASRDIKVYNNKIYCAFSGNNKHVTAKFIDVYNTTDGDYLYSFKLPAFARAIAVSNSKLFVLQRYSDRKDKMVTITIYQLP